MQKKFLSVVAVTLGLFSNLLTGCSTSISSNANQAVASKDNVALGLAYLNRGDKVRSKDRLLRALAESPDDPVAIDAMAYFWESTENTELAAQYYERAYKIAPNDGAVLNNYGIFLCKQHKIERAEKLFLKAASLENYINTAKAYENAGVCALTVNDKAKANDYFSKALAN